MSSYHIQNGFAAGEISPSLWGRTDLAKYALGGSTVRNCFINYRGGASSRPGLAYVGMCKQDAPNAGGTNTTYPPRDIPFQFSLTQGYVLEFGDQYLRIKSEGAYVLETAKTVSAITQANPGVVTSTSHGFNNGDWVFGSSIGGMTEFNGLTWIVQNKTTNTFTLTDLFGNPVNTLIFPAYISGGTFARLYTVVAPYAAADLQYLKYTQSADTMTLTCVNQDTGTEYPSYELVRNGATNWVFTADSFASSISAPTGVAATAQASTTLSTYYSYVVTAIDAVTGEESIASKAASVQNNDISVNAGSNTITWTAVTGASSYNVYGAIPSYNAIVPAGVNYGFLGQSFGGSFVDTNIVADFNTVPPTHQDPFARGAIIGVTPTAVGSGYTQAGVTYTLTTSAGSGAVLLPIVVGGKVVAYIVQNGGKGYANGDTITLTADGSGATALLVFGAATGTYPSVCAYYQQRRVYANTKNNPDTYYMSQPGAFNNMDSAVPSIDSDAIVGTPWSQQINGIQFLQPMPGGLVVLSGNGAWQVNGGTSAAITPAGQTANPQAYNGCNNHIGPIVVNYDILYVQAKGSIVRDLSYNFFVNIYTGTDLTILSNHLFSGHQLQQWAYAEEPYKLVWTVRDDGILLCLTYLKEQDIYAWSRHDTNGLFVGVCSVVEPPVDAVYVIVQRFVHGVWVYYSERMDNRQWLNSEDCFCVDSGLAYSMTQPNATLTPAAAEGTSNISSTFVINGGSGYTNPQAQAVDSEGFGTGATFSVTTSGGAVTSVTPLTQGINYTPGATQIIITDPTGKGAIVNPVITNYVTFTTSSSVFTAGMVGDVIRVGGGKATIVQYVSGTQVVANITQPITQVVPDDPNNTPIPATQTSVDRLTASLVFNWTISTPTSSVTGLNHLEGLEVAILADGSVVPNQTVVNGTIILPQPYSQITIGLPFIAQVQTLYSDAKEGLPDTPQGKRKSIPAVILRTELSRGFSAGVNQPDASIQPNQATVPWPQGPGTRGMVEAKERNALIHAGSAIPLFSGDSYIEVNGDWDSRGQIACQQLYPLPLNLLAAICISGTGDIAG